MGDLLTFLVLLAAGYFAGAKIEQKHYRQILEREHMFVTLPVVTGKTFIDGGPVVEESRLVWGNVVVCADYFKVVLSGLRNLLGGEMNAFESVLDRGRREAVLRMKEMAAGADIIVNMRIESTQVQPNGTTELLAYGTAVYYKKS